MDFPIFEVMRSWDLKDCLLAACLSVVQINYIRYLLKQRKSNEILDGLLLFLLFYIKEMDEPKRKEKRHKGGTSGFLAPLPLSDALVKFLGTGESALPRSDVVKRIWDYIKQNNLQVIACN